MSPPYKLVACHSDCIDQQNVLHITLCIHISLKIVDRKNSSDIELYMALSPAARALDDCNSVTNPIARTRTTLLTNRNHKRMY